MWNYIAYVFYAIIACVSGLWIIKTRNPVKYYAKFGIYMLSTLVVSVLLIPVMALDPRNLKNGLLIARVLKHVSTVLEIKWQLRNGKVLGEKRGAIVIANHQSSLDILGLYSVGNVSQEMAPVCRKEVLYLGPFGLAAYLTGCIFIDRAKPEVAHSILKASAEAVFKNKDKVWLFPEGTRNKNPAILQPFKKGAFSLAIACQVPIIPLVMSPYYFLDAKRKIFDKGHVIIQCLEAVPTEGLTMENVEELKNKVQNMMQKAYDELRKEINETILPQYSITTKDKSS